MAVLSEALLHCCSQDVQLQALSAWLVLVKGLAARAPQLLERVAAQAAVVLLPVLEAEAAGQGEGGQQQRDAGERRTNLFCVVVCARNLGGFPLCLGGFRQVLQFAPAQAAVVLPLLEAEAAAHGEREGAS